MSDGVALSALDWWREAGVDTLVDDSPRDWLAAATPVVAVTPPTPAAPAMPGDLPAFRRFLLASDAVPLPTNGRLDAAGDPAAGAMIVLDMPDTADRPAGALLAGAVGGLFDKMLAAIGLARATIYLAPFAPARPIGGKLDAGQCAALADLMRHHLALVRPQRLLLLGEAPVRALTGLAMTEARGATRTIEYDGGAVPAITSCHPRLLVAKPEYKAEAWADLKRFMAL